MKNGKSRLKSLLHKAINYIKPSSDNLTEPLKQSFREVIRLAKSGQQSWWSDDLKRTTSHHIEQVEQYYDKHLSK